MASIKIDFDFEELYKNLTKISEVANDNLMDISRRNFTIKLENGKVNLVAVSQQVLYTLNMSDKTVVTITPEDGEVLDANPIYLLVACKPVLDYLATYANDVGMKILETCFTTSNTTNLLKVKVVVEEEETKRVTESSWDFTKVAVNQNHIQSITRQKLPDDALSQIKGEDLKVYTENLNSKLDTGVGVYSKANFGEDYVVVFDKTHNTFMKNKLSDKIKGLGIYHRGVAFIDKVMCDEETLTVGVSGDTLYLGTPDSEAYIKCDVKLPDYSKYTSIYNNDHCISVSKKYLDGALRRVLLAREEQIIIRVSAEDGLTLNNTKLKQNIPIISMTDMDLMQGKQVKILPETFSKALLPSSGADGLINMCVVQIKDNLVLFCLYDNSGDWFTTINAKLMDA